VDAQMTVSQYSCGDKKVTIGIVTTPADVLQEAQVQVLVTKVDQATGDEVIDTLQVSKND